MALKFSVSSSEEMLTDRSRSTSLQC